MEACKKLEARSSVDILSINEDNKEKDEIIKTMSQTESMAQRDGTNMNANFVIGSVVIVVCLWSPLRKSAT